MKKFVEFEDSSLGKMSSALPSRHRNPPDLEIKWQNNIYIYVCEREGGGGIMSGFEPDPEYAGGGISPVRWSSKVDSAYRRRSAAPRDLCRRERLLQEVG